MAYVQSSHQHEPHPQHTRVTTDHDEIRRWVESHGGRPARVRGNVADDRVGLLRIDFGQKHAKEPLMALSWEDFFDRFDSSDLAMLYRVNGNEGGGMPFHRLVHRGNLYCTSE